MWSLPSENLNPLAYFQLKSTGAVGGSTHYLYTNEFRTLVNSEFGVKYVNHRSTDSLIASSNLSNSLMSYVRFNAKTDEVDV